MDPAYKIMAYVTANQNRKVSGAPMFLTVDSPEEAKELTSEIAHALKADVVKLKNNDYLIIHI